jgi:hypothetical protein
LHGDAALAVTAAHRQRSSRGPRGRQAIHLGGASLHEQLVGALGARKSRGSEFTRGGRPGYSSARGRPDQAVLRPDALRLPARAVATTGRARPRPRTRSDRLPVVDRIRHRIRPGIRIGFRPWMRDRSEVEPGDRRALLMAPSVAAAAWESSAVSATKPGRSVRWPNRCSECALLRALGRGVTRAALAPARSQQCGGMWGRARSISICC